MRLINVVLILLPTFLLACTLSKAVPARSTFTTDAIMPPFEVDGEDEYLCTAISLPNKPLKLTSIESLSTEDVVHHMLLFGCASPANTDQPVWRCNMGGTCGPGGESVLYGWGKNAPKIELPDDTGFSVGEGTAIATMVLQVHYLIKRPLGDTSGVRLNLSDSPVTYSAGMVAYAAAFVVPPGIPSHLVPNTCCYNSFEPLRAFAYRVHTHALGSQVTLDKTTIDPSSFLGGINTSTSNINSTELSSTRIASKDPQLPQGFYPLDKSPPHHHHLIIFPGDHLKATCVYNSTSQTHPVTAGNTHKDEMCNLYLMLYGHLPFFMWCVNDSAWVEREGPGGVPDRAVAVLDDRVWKPPRIVDGGEVGQVSGVAVDYYSSLNEGGGEKGGEGGKALLSSSSSPAVWLFHRADRPWDGDTFQGYKLTAENNIDANVLVKVDMDSGKVLSSIGGGLFGLPHMISIDYDGNLWVTDVGLHQVLKISGKTGQVMMTLGQARSAGSGVDTFCKPTQAVVARDGSVYVADGYCNSRIMKFNGAGEFIKEFRLPSGPQMQIPHSLAIDECRGVVYVADRENGMVHALNKETGQQVKQQSRFPLNLSEKGHGLPYSLVMGPYGSLLVLTWDRDGTGKVELVNIDAREGITAHWELPEVEAPHDLALVPAPLEYTGAGERRLAVIVAETREPGKKSLVHKYMFTLPENADSNGSRSEKKKEAEVEKVEEVKKPEGIEASHIGNVDLKPVDDVDDYDGEEGEGEEEVEEDSKESQGQSFNIDEEDYQSERNGKEEEEENINTTQQQTSATNDDEEEEESTPRLPLAAGRTGWWTIVIGMVVVIGAMAMYQWGAPTKLKGYKPTGVRDDTTGGSGLMNGNGNGAHSRHPQV